MHWQLHQIFNLVWLTLFIIDRHFCLAMIGWQLERGCRTLRATWQVTKTTTSNTLVHTKYTIQSYKIGLCTLTTPSSTIHTFARSYSCVDRSLDNKLRIFTLNLYNFCISSDLHLRLLK